MDIVVNYWAVLVCGVAAMVTGGLWYGTLFGKLWAKDMGFDMSDTEKMARMKKDAMKNYPQQFIGALLTAYVLLHVLNAFDADSIGLALQGAFWIWLGFYVPVKYGDKLWGGKPLRLFFIDAAYYLILLGVMSAILVSWK